MAKELDNIIFEKQEKADYNSHGHYQFGSNSCVGCKVDRPLTAKGMWCDGCMNYKRSTK